MTYKIATVLIVAALALAAQPSSVDPSTLPIRKYMPKDFKRLVAEAPDTRIADLNAILPAALDTLPALGYAEDVAKQKAALGTVPRTVYSHQFSAPIGEQETAIHSITISIYLRAYPTYREAELGLAGRLASLPVDFSRGTYSGASIGELCYRGSPERSRGGISFLRKNVHAAITVSYYHAALNRRDSAPPREPIDAHALAEELASKIDAILATYTPVPSKRE